MFPKWSAQEAWKNGRTFSGHADLCWSPELGRMALRSPAGQIVDVGFGDGDGLTNGNHKSSGFAQNGS